MWSTRVALAAAFASLIAVAPALAQTPLEAALELYAAASYDDALSALDTAKAAQPSTDDLVTIEQHRLLCLVALGRTAAAQDVVAGLLDARPEFVLTAGDASPRVRAVFDAARARVLPDLVRRRYTDAKRAYEAGEFAQARDEFAHVSALLSEPTVLAADPSALDLRTLTEGFRQLSVASLERARKQADLDTLQAAMRVVQVSSEPPMAPFMPAALPAPDAREPHDGAVVGSMSAPGASPVPSVAASPRFAPLGIFTYDWRDGDVAAPVALAQPVTGWWGSMGEPAAGTQLGAIEVVVDESGAVTDARVYLSVNRVYDNVLLESVKHWRYKPATKDGRPVKYRRVSGVVSGR